MLGPASGRLHYLIVATAAVLLLLAFLHSTGTVTMSRDSFQHGWAGSESDSNSGTPQPPAPGSEPGVPSSPESAATPPSSDGNVYTPIDPVSSSGGSITYNHAAKPGPSFQEVALKYGTDKVTTHKYQFMYEKYLNPLQGKKLKMLEIGLGCNMAYGPGASYYTWLEYLPFVELYYIEYDKACAEKWASKTDRATVFTGDQADTAFLADFIAKTTGNGQPLFDIIVDDGGHTMTQQLTSLEHLWKIVKPGGIYFIEDLQTSYWEVYGGDPTTKDDKKVTAMKYIYQLVDDMMIDGKKHPEISAEIRSIDCMKEVCALIKKDEGSK